MSKQAAKLSGFKTGWKRHPENSEIILTSNVGIFMAAANDNSCRAAILKVSKAKKDADREAFKKVWDNASSPRALNQHGNAVYNHTFNDLDIDDAFELKPAGEQILEASRLYCEMSGEDRALPNIIINWREKEQAHDPHIKDVLNRVFFAGGTLLETEDGYFQVDEGDFLYIKAGTAHYPEAKTEENKDQPRLTLAIAPQGL